MSDSPETTEPGRRGVSISTLADLQRHGYELVAHCGAPDTAGEPCGWSHTLDLPTLAAVYGARHPYTGGALKLKCARCGQAADFTVNPSTPSAWRGMETDDIRKTDLRAAIEVCERMADAQQRDTVAHLLAMAKITLDDGQ